MYKIIVILATISSRNWESINTDNGLCKEDNMTVLNFKNFKNSNNYINLLNKAREQYANLSSQGITDK